MTKQERKEYHKKWRLKNPEKIKEYAGRYKEYNKKYRLEHKDEIKKCIDLWTKNNPERCKMHRRRTLLKNLYGITIEDYNNIFLKQKGTCGICGMNQEQCKRSLHVDHNHSKGNNRGLLCPNCNHFVGWIEKNPDIINKVDNYLKKWRS
jgi:hypothetical protein